MPVDLPGVAVLGGGPIGCLTAIYLRRRGFNVDVFESRADMRVDKAAAGRSINLILTSRGLNALNEVGLTANIIKKCVPVYGRGLHLQDGTQKYQAYGPDPTYCNYAISRADLNIALLNAAEEAGARVHFNHSVDHIDVGKKIVYFYVRDHSPFRTQPRLKYTPKQLNVIQGEMNPDGKPGIKKATPGHTYGVSVKALSIFGCDGANSRSRQSLHQFLQSSTGVSNGVATPFGHSLSAMELQDPNKKKGKDKDNKNRENNSNNNNNNSNNDTASKQQETIFPTFPVDFRSAFDLSGSYDTSIPLRVSYLELLLKREDNINTETGEEILSTKALHIWPRGHHFLMALPNHDGSFTLTLYLPDVQIGSTPSFSTLRTNDDIRQYFVQYYADIIPLLPDLVEQWNSHPKGFLGSVQSFPWHFRNNLVLLGDAGASVTPFFGQGCNSGMESVSTLFNHMDYFAKVKVPTLQLNHCNPIDSNTTNNDNNNNNNDIPIIAPIFNPRQCLQQYTPYVLQKAFSTLSSNHKINTDAIASMAVENYIEMGTSTGDVNFLRSAQYETLLSQHFPTTFLSRYAMTTHSLIPYSIVYTLGEIQKQHILSVLINDEIKKNNNKPLTMDILSTPPILDVQMAKKLLDTKYQPILDKYNINAYSLRDVTRELVQNALNHNNCGNNNNNNNQAKL